MSGNNRSARSFEFRIRGPVTFSQTRHNFLETKRVRRDPGNGQLRPGIVLFCSPAPRTSNQLPGENLNLNAIACNNPSARLLHLSWQISVRGSANVNRINRKRNYGKLLHFPQVCLISGCYLQLDLNSESKHLSRKSSNPNKTTRTA